MQPLQPDLFRILYNFFLSFEDIQIMLFSLLEKVVVKVATVGGNVVLAYIVLIKHSLFIVTKCSVKLPHQHQIYQLSEKKFTIT